MVTIIQYSPKVSGGWKFFGYGKGDNFYYLAKAHDTACGSLPIYKTRPLRRELGEPLNDSPSVVH